MSQIVDYYSGMTMPNRSTWSDDNYETTVSIDYNGRKFDISYVYMVDWEDNKFNYVKQNNGWYLGSRNLGITNTIKITVPEDYDGLMLGNLFAMDAHSNNNYDEIGTDPYLFDGNPSEYWFIRLSDYAVEENK